MKYLSKEGLAHLWSKVGSVGKILAADIAADAKSAELRVTQDAGNGGTHQTKVSIPTVSTTRTGMLKSEDYNQFISNDNDMAQGFRKLRAFAENFAQIAEYRGNTNNSTLVEGVDDAPTPWVMYDRGLARFVSERNNNGVKMRYGEFSGWEKFGTKTATGVAPASDRLYCITDYPGLLWWNGSELIALNISEKSAMAIAELVGKVNANTSTLEKQAAKLQKVGDLALNNERIADYCNEQIGQLLTESVPLLNRQPQLLAFVRTRGTMVQIFPAVGTGVTVEAVTKKPTSIVKIACEQWGELANFSLRAFVVGTNVPEGIGVEPPQVFNCTANDAGSVSINFYDRAGARAHVGNWRFAIYYVPETLSPKVINL
ncbi:MAG: hypothetical protein NC204_05760 [Candidatus Amulumruptor caecigallinarius]|nr:hypothetical protein [Candidatus Amulumruptor caecigallinarius]